MEIAFPAQHIHMQTEPPKCCTVDRENNYITMPTVTSSKSLKIIYPLLSDSVSACIKLTTVGAQQSTIQSICVLFQLCFP